MDMDISKHLDIKKNKSLLRKGSITPLLFISPWVIGFLIFTLGPLLFSLVMSFFNWPVIGKAEFVGFGNYIHMFTKDAQFGRSLLITVKFAALFVPLNMIVSLILAILISSPVKGSRVFRTIFYLPSVVSGVAVSIIWGWILNSEYGILNYGLSLLGIDGPRWLSNPNWAMIAMVIASVWGLGTMMLIFYTGLKSIPTELYEAAAIDGATPLVRFFKITLPLLSPTMLFNLITSTIGALQQLTLALLLTNGGPSKSTYFYGMYVYNNAFKHFKLGYASANAWFMFIIILCLTVLIFKSSYMWVFYENEVVGKKKKKGGKVNEAI